MTLIQAFNEHLVKGHQGQLVIKFAGDVHLCKILVEDGIAVHIAHGRLTPQLILDSLPGKVVEWANFIAGYPVRKKVDFPLHSKLLAAVENQPSVAQHQPAAPSATMSQISEPALPSGGEMVSAEKVAAAIDGFIDVIGPLGTLLADNVAASLNLSSDTAMSESIFDRFVLALAAEMPDAERGAFLDRFKR